MQRTPTTKDNDVTVNKYVLSVAEFAKTAQSWLDADAGGIRSGSGVHAVAVADEDDPPELEPEPFSDLTGVGYVTHESSTGDLTSVHNRQTSAATEKLRRQMLGKRAKFLGTQHSTLTANRANPGLVTSRHASGRLRGKSDDSDEDEGRSHIGRKGRDLASRPPIEEPEVSSFETGPADVSTTSLATTQPPSTTSKKRTSTFLDEILAERANKKKKKKNQAKKGSGG